MYLSTSRPHAKPELSVLQSFKARALLPLSPDRIWRIEQGRVRTLTWNEQGYVTTLGIWGQQDVVVGFPLAQIHPFQMECLTPVVVGELPKDSPLLPEALLAHLCRSQQLFKIAHQPKVAERLQQLLYWLANRFGQRVPQGLLLDPCLTHHQIAETLGSSRVTITRLFGHLMKTGEVLRPSQFKEPHLKSLSSNLPKRAIVLPLEP
jgi:CRP-like cAMP-binding protein